MSSTVLTKMKVMKEFVNSLGLRKCSVDVLFKGMLEHFSTEC